MAIIALLAIPYAKSEIPETLSFRSPDRRWEFIAKHFENGAFPGYRTKILDLKTHKIYCNETIKKIQDNEILPKRIDAFWSPDSKFLAINYYYARICYGTSIIDLTDHVPNPRSLFDFAPQVLELENNLQMVGESVGAWTNRTDLPVSLEYRSPQAKSPYPDSTYSLLIRFENNQGTIIKKKRGEL